MPDVLNWLLVFLRGSALLAIFPVFSGPNFPVQLRIALGALLSFLVAPLLPVPTFQQLDLWKLLGLMICEVGFGLLLGFVSRMVFYALDFAGGLISTELGLTLPGGLSPISQSPTSEISSLMQSLGAMLFLAMNMHHDLLAAFQRSYQFLPIGGGHLRESLLVDIINRTGSLFTFAIQMAAPLLAVTFILLLVFAVLARAVPQMNVFTESFSIKLLCGLTVFGFTCQLMAQHIANFLNRLPTDVLRVAQMLGGT